MPSWQKIIPNGHYVIEGQAFPSGGCIYTIAVRKGFNGSKQTLLNRLSKGMNKWDDLCVPVDEKSKRSGSIRNGKAQAEMQAMIEELDRRKSSFQK